MHRPVAHLVGVVAATVAQGIIGVMAMIIMVMMMMMIIILMVAVYMHLWSK